MDPVPAPSYFREVSHPPFVVFTDVSVTPIGSGDLAGHAFEVGKVIPPIVALAYDRGWIIPVVVAVTVRGEMNIAQCGVTWVCFLISAKPLPQVFVVR